MSISPCVQILEVGRDPGATIHTGIVASLCTDRHSGSLRRHQVLTLFVVFSDGQVEDSSPTEMLDSPFEGVRMVTQSSWSVNSTKINESNFDTVKSQEAYAALFQIAANLTVSALISTWQVLDPFTQCQHVRSADAAAGELGG